MNRIRPAAAFRLPAVPSVEAVAIFDLQGRMLLASEEFMGLLQHRSLVEELLMIPRALALRQACGYPPDTGRSVADRAIFFRGRVYHLRGRYMEASTAPSSAALVLHVTSGGAEPAPRTAPAEGQRMTTVSGRATYRSHARRDAVALPSAS